MRRIFADAFFYLAILNRRDHAHDVAHEWAARTDFDILTTEFVLLEVADALSAPNARRLAAAFIHAIREDVRTQIIPVSPSLLAKALQLYEQRPDKSWSLTDCTSFVTMQIDGTTPPISTSLRRATARRISRGLCGCGLLRHRLIKALEGRRSFAMAGSEFGSTDASGTAILKVLQADK